MPQVPSIGTQRVSPQLDPTPRFSVDANPAAFGVNVAQATEHLGQVADQAGGELFTRAIAMQDLYNHSEAQQADADYMQKAGELHAQFLTLQGKAAVDAYPKYISDLKQSREDIGNALSNSMSQKLYQATSLSTMGRTIFNGAGHAGPQNKDYAMTSSKATVQAIDDQTISNPTDDNAFQQGLVRSEGEIRAQSQLKGFSQEAEDEAVAQNRSKLWSQRIQGLARQQPIAAGKMLEDGIKSGDIRGEDIAKMTNLVQTQRNTVGARIVSSQVSSGANNRFGQGTVDIKQAGEAIGQIESGGNYGTIGVQTQHGRALGKYQVMEEFLPEFLQKAGLPPMTGDEFLKNHAAQDQVFATNFGAYMKQTGSANDAASMWLTGKTQAQAGNVKDPLGTNSQTYVTRFNAALAKNAPLSAKVDMGAQIAQEQAPNDPLFPDYVRQRVETDHNQQLAIRRDDDFQNRQVIETALMGQEGAKLPTTVDELTMDPKVDQSWQKLEPSVQRRYMDIMAKNAKGDHNWTSETLSQYQQFKGMAATDPAKFIDEDVIGTDLPNSAKRELINLQQRSKTNAQGDPRVARALSILAPDMQAAGIVRTDKDDYYQFVGALADQLEGFSQDNKRPPKADEIKTIGSRLMQSQRVPGYLWDSNTPTYQLPVPKDEADTIRTDPEWTKLGITPTDQQVQRIYTRKKYQELYGSAPKTNPIQPQVPQSK